MFGRSVAKKCVQTVYANCINDAKMKSIYLQFILLIYIHQWNTAYSDWSGRSTIATYYNGLYDRLAPLTTE